MLLRIYQRAELNGFNYNAPDVHQRIQIAFQKRVIGGRPGDSTDKEKCFGKAEERAQRLRAVWITDSATRTTVELILKNVFAFRKNIIEVS